MRADPSNPVSRLELEHWALGRLDADRAATLERLGAADPELRARMERVRAEITRAAVQLPPLALPADEAPARRWSWKLAVGGLALAAALALLLVRPPTDDPVPDLWRGGSVDLELVRVRLGEAQPQGAIVHGLAGDRLQLGVTLSEPGWLQIYDLQDDGVVQAWLEPRQVPARQPVELAVLLDDYQGVERIFVLVSPQPITLQQVEAAAARAFHDPLPVLDRLPGLGEQVLQRSVLVLEEDGS